ncbi:hypothetical protein ACMFMG_005301 [Clarireedia jacksonii]
MSKPEMIMAVSNIWGNVLPVVGYLPGVDPALEVDFDDHMGSLDALECNQPQIRAEQRASSSGMRGPCCCRCNQHSHKLRPLISTDQKRMNSPGVCDLEVNIGFPSGKVSSIR